MDVESSAALRAQLREFEARADASDPEQQKLLEVMREHIRGLERVRGDWNAPVGDRDWNAPPAQQTAAAPLADEAFRAYKEHKAREERIARLARGERPETVPALTQGEAGRSG